MACRVVSWRVTGVVDAVENGVSGVLTQFGDEAALTQAVIRLVTEPGLMQSLAVGRSPSGSGAL